MDRKNKDLKNCESFSKNAHAKFQIHSTTETYGRLRWNNVDNNLLYTLPIQIKIWQSKIKSLFYLGKHTMKQCPNYQLQYVKTQLNENFSG